MLDTVTLVNLQGTIPNVGIDVDPVVIPAANGFAVFWNVRYSDGTTNVLAQRFTMSGDPAGEIATVTNSTALNRRWQGFTPLAAWEGIGLANGDYLVCSTQVITAPAEPSQDRIQPYIGLALHVSSELSAEIWSIASLPSQTIPLAMRRTAEGVELLAGQYAFTPVVSRVKLDPQGKFQSQQDVTLPISPTALYPGSVVQDGDGAMLAVYLQGDINDSGIFDPDPVLQATIVSRNGSQTLTLRRDCNPSNFAARSKLIALGGSFLVLMNDGSGSIQGYAIAPDQARPGSYIATSTTVVASVSVTNTPHAIVLGDGSIFVAWPEATGMVCGKFVSIAGLALSDEIAFGDQNHMFSIFLASASAQGNEVLAAWSNYADGAVNVQLLRRDPVGTVLDYPARRAPSHMLAQSEARKIYAPPVVLIRAAESDQTNSNGANPTPLVTCTLISRSVSLDEDTSLILTPVMFGITGNLSGMAQVAAISLTRLPNAGVISLAGSELSGPGPHDIALGDLAAGALIYTPTANGNGKGYDSLKYVAIGTVREEGTEPTSATLTFDVRPITDAPSIDRDGIQFDVTAQTDANACIPTVASFADGGFVVAWKELADSSIHARMFSADGQHLMQETTVSEIGVPSGTPTITASAHTFTVAWTTTTGTRARSSARSLPGGMLPVFSVDDSHGEVPAIATLLPRPGMDATATAPWNVIAWAQNIGADRAVDYDLRVRVVDGNGNGKVAPFTANAIRASDQYSPSVASLPGGGFALAWHDQTGEGVTARCKLRLFDADGQPKTSEILLSEQVGDVYPSVATFADGSLVVAWEGTRDQNRAILARRFHADGTAAGSELRVSTSTGNREHDSAIAALDDGSFVVVWTDDVSLPWDKSGDGNGACVLLRAYDATDRSTGAPTVVNSSIANDQVEPAVAALPNAGFVVVWTDQHAGPSWQTALIRGQRFRLADADRMASNLAPA